MASIKFTIKSKPNNDGKHSIVLVLIKNRKNTSMATKYSCDYDAWSFETKYLKTNRKGQELKRITEINNFISKTNLKIENFIREKRRLNIDFTIRDVANEVKADDITKVPILDYYKFHQEITDEFLNSNKIGTAKIYTETLSSLKKFYPKSELHFQNLNYEFLKKYDSFLRANGGTDSGISIRMRTIKAIFNNAIKREIILANNYPFRYYKTSALKKEAKREYLTDEELQRLIAADFSSNKKYQFAKDMYLFSFYCRGLNFIDLLQLKNSNKNDERLSYIRTKTGVHLDVKLKNHSLDIINNYQYNSMNSYLFPLLLNENMTVKQIKNRSHKLLGQINPALRDIMQFLKIDKNITFYTARHTFATFLKFENISTDAISEMLGHTDIRTTQSYLNNLPNKKLDKIIDDVFENSKYF